MINIANGRNADELSKLNINLYNLANEWIDFKEGENIFGISTNILIYRIKRAHLSLKVKKDELNVEKQYFRKLDYLKIILLNEKEIMEKYKMSLKTLKELVNEGVIHTIKLSNKIYYYYKFNSKYSTTISKVKSYHSITIEEAYKFCSNEFCNYDDFISYVFKNKEKFSLRYVYKLNKWFVSNSITRKDKKIQSLKMVSFYAIHNFNIDLYNTANEWIDFKQGKEIFGVSANTLSFRIRRANLSIKVKRNEKNLEKHYFHKLDYIKLFFLDKNEAIKKYKIPLNVLNELVNKKIISTIEINGETYYHYMFNEELNSQYSTTILKVKIKKLIAIEEAYNFYSKEFSNYDDFVLNVFMNIDKFKPQYVYKLSKWFISNLTLEENKKRDNNVFNFYTNHKLNLELYNSANEWIDYKEGAEIFGTSNEALRSRLIKLNFNFRVEKIRKNVSKYYFRKLDYIKLFFLDENEAIEKYKIPSHILDKFSNEGIIKKIEINGCIYYHNGLNDKYYSYESTVKLNKAITIEEAYKYRYKDFDNYENFILYIFENKDKFYLRYVQKLNNWFVSNSITGIKRKLHRINPEQKMYYQKIRQAYSYVDKMFNSYEEFKEEIMNNKIKYNVQFINEEFYVDLSKIFLKPYDAAKKLKMNYKTLMKWLKDDFFDIIEISTKYFLITSIQNKTPKDYLEFMANKNNTLPALPREMFESESYMIDYYMKWINDRTEFKDSIKWIGYSINNFSEKSKATRSKFHKIKTLLLTAFRLSQKLKKEIYYYDNKEINELYSTILGSQDDMINIKMILGYIMHNRLNCNYNDLPSVYINKKKNEGVNDRFSPEIVERYFHYLADLDRHFLNAINNYRYAQLWLISMLHLSMPRRMGDMIDLPKPDIELANIYSFDDLFNRDITMSDMQIIIDNIKAKSYGEVASKNGWDFAFVRDLDLITQTGIAFTICELHRRENGEEVLNFSFKNTNPKGDDWKKFFDDEFLKGFGNLKAVRSFLVDIYKYTSNIPDLRVLSYSIITKFRAHKTNGIDESEVTKEYLEITKVDGFQDKIIYNVQKIGAFGFLYNLLINLAYDTSEISLEDQISYIENLKENLSKKSIENVSSFLSDTIENLNRIPKDIISFSEKANVLLENKFMEDMKCYNEYKISEQIALAKEVIKHSREEIRNKIEDVFKNLQNSKQPYSYCFKGFQNCKNRSSSPSVCIICKYSIPTVYTLSYLEKNLNNLFEKIKTTPLDNKQMLFKYKILLLKYIGVISEAYNEFIKYDEKFINSFINLRELEKKVIEIEKNVFDKAGGLR